MRGPTEASSCKSQPNVCPTNLQLQSVIRALNAGINCGKTHVALLLLCSSWASAWFEPNAAVSSAWEQGFYFFQNQNANSTSDNSFHCKISRVLWGQNIACFQPKKTKMRGNKDGLKGWFLVGHGCISSSSIIFWSILLHSIVLMHSFKAFANKEVKTPPPSRPWKPIYNKQDWPRKKLQKKKWLHDYVVEHPKMLNYIFFSKKHVYIGKNHYYCCCKLYLCTIVVVCIFTVDFPSFGVAKRVLPNHIISDDAFIVCCWPRLVNKIRLVHQ